MASAATATATATKPKAPTTNQGSVAESFLSQIGDAKKVAASRPKKGSAAAATVAAAPSTAETATVTTTATGDDVSHAETEPASTEKSDAGTAKAKKAPAKPRERKPASETAGTKAGKSRATGGKGKAAVAKSDSDVEDGVDPLTRDVLAAPAIKADPEDVKMDFTPVAGGKTDGDAAVVTAVAVKSSRKRGSSRGLIVTNALAPTVRRLLPATLLTPLLKNTVDGFKELSQEQLEAMYGPTANDPEFWKGVFEEAKKANNLERLRIGIEQTLTSALTHLRSKNINLAADVAIEQSISLFAADEPVSIGTFFSIVSRLVDEHAILEAAGAAVDIENFKVALLPAERSPMLRLAVEYLLTRYFGAVPETWVTGDALAAWIDTQLALPEAPGHHFMVLIPALFKSAIIGWRLRHLEEGMVLLGHVYASLVQMLWFSSMLDINNVSTLQRKPPKDAFIHELVEATKAVEGVDATTGASIVKTAKDLLIRDYSDFFYKHAHAVDKNDLNTIKKTNKLGVVEVVPSTGYRVMSSGSKNYKIALTQLHEAFTNNKSKWIQAMLSHIKVGIDEKTNKPMRPFSASSDNEIGRLYLLDKLIEGRAWAAPLKRFIALSFLLAAPQYVLKCQAPSKKNL
jgi:hypothetical protein